jgi:hypothetical protein
MAANRDPAEWAYCPGRRRVVAESVCYSAGEADPELIWLNQGSRFEKGELRTSATALMPALFNSSTK